MPKYPGISPYDNEKGDLGSAKKRWNKIYVKEIESDTVSGINASIENLATTAENSVSAAVSAKNDAVAAKTAAQAAQTAAETAAAGIQSVVETDVDNTLSIAGVAADAKVTGDWLRDIAKPVTLDTSMPATAYADEYMKVTTDSEGRVLYGVKRDGTFTWQKGVPKHLQDKINELAAPTIDNDEYMYVMLDSEGHVLFGVKRDGSFDWQKGVPKHVQDMAQQFIDNDEYLYVMLDSDQRVLFGIKMDGSLCFAKHDVANEGVFNKEYLQITVDNGNRLIEGVTTEGEKMFGAKVGFYNDVFLSPNAASGVIDSLKQVGFSGGAGDWSTETSLQIPLPRCAIVNFSGISDIPQAKGVDMQGTMSFWDMQGNYFRKKVIMNAQGQYSMNYAKKNIAIDICNDDWIGDDTFALKVGDWVSQDSFHLKAYWVDFFKGMSVAAYRFMDAIWGARSISENRPWKKALINMEDVDVLDRSAVTDVEMMIDTGARNMPDGFPCLVFVNGDFYGIYSFQLKKHYANMHQSKSNAKHIHLDSRINYNNIFKGTVEWTQLEVRNPKKLYCMDGTKYDGDDNRNELIDATSPNYKASNADHVRSNTVKSYVVRLASAMPALKDADTAYNADPSASNLNRIKQIYESFFDVDNQIDYLIFSDVLCNWDGTTNNAQWCTYDGLIWYVCPYDLDNICNREPLTGHISSDKFYPWYYIAKYYKTKLEARYSELRKLGIISVKSFVDTVDSWTKAVGESYYDKEMEKWPSSHKDNMPRLIKWMIQSIENMDALYHYSTEE